MINSLRITVLVDNYVQKPGLLAEHGLSIWVEADDTRILFDTGQGYALRHNARALGVDLSKADAVVLSHGHYDHTGGLSSFLNLNPAARIYLHPAALGPKYSATTSPYARYVGFPDASREALDNALPRVVFTSGETSLTDNIHVTGEILEPDRELNGNDFFLDPESENRDFLIDDQALYLETIRGTVVVLGCTHSGVIPTLEHISRISSPERIIAVIGGMHLEKATLGHLEGVRQALHHFGVGLIAPCHCSGIAAAYELGRSFPDGFVPMAVGQQLEV